MDVNAEQELNVLTSNNNKLLGRTMDERDVQPKKTFAPRFIRFVEEILIDIKDVQPLKVSVPIVITLEGMVIDVRAIHVSKTWLSMLVTLEGMVIDVRAVPKNV